MRRERQRQSRRSVKGRFALIAILSVISGQVWAGEAGGEPASDGLFGSLMEKLNLRTRVGPAPDFVEKTRPDPSSLHFIPTSQPHPKRAVRVKSGAEVDAAKAALDAARAAQLNPRAPVQLVPPHPLPAATPGLGSAKHPAKLKRITDQN